MSEPRVSVVLTTFERERYLGAAIRSALDQTSRDLELIVVDDGSTDGTPDLVLGVGDPRVRYIRQEHRGMCSALNTGVRAARAGYIAHLDSDDVWLEEMLEVETQVLDARPDVGAVYARSQGMDEGGNPLPEFRGYPERFPGRSFESMLYGDFTSSITVVARRACYERAGWWDESFTTGADWDMWMRMSRHFPFAFVDRVLARFRLHGGNVSGPGSPLFAKELDGRTWVLDKAFSLPDLPPEALARKGACYANVHTEAALRWFRAGEYRRAARAFVRAVRAGPSPTFTVARIAWFALGARVLNRSALGRRFLRFTADLRRRRRTRPAPDLRPVPSPDRT